MYYFYGAPWDDSKHLPQCLDLGPVIMRAPNASPRHTRPDNEVFKARGHRRYGPLHVLWMKLNRYFYVYVDNFSYSLPLKQYCRQLQSNWSQSQIPRLKQSLEPSDRCRLRIIAVISTKRFSGGHSSITSVMVFPDCDGSTSSSLEFSENVLLKSSIYFSNRSTGSIRRRGAENSFLTLRTTLCH